jgi:hypothetical protein
MGPRKVKAPKRKALVEAALTPPEDLCLCFVFADGMKAVVPVTRHAETVPITTNAPYPVYARTIGIKPALTDSIVDSFNRETLSGISTPETNRMT